ncbi:MAG: hypothetical protein Q9222_000002 [Ikaeria aurantiellina]
MAKPISVQPSQQWYLNSTVKLSCFLDGNDGPWSSFAVRVGTPPQTVRVFASTTVPETWVVLTEGCVSGDPVGCDTSRGQLFSPNASSTWNIVNDFELGVEKNLRNYSSNWDHGRYGFDTLALGYQGSGGPSVNHSVVAAIATKDFYLGNIGLSAQSINFTTYDNSPPSLLTQLKNTKQIPSLSYGYNAGAPYRLKKVLGSLTLGGYDTSRLIANNLNFTFADDISRDLVVGLQSIISSDEADRNRELLPESIYTFIDSTVPHIWLPIEACRAFEDAFGLIYDNTTDLYLVNSTLHDTLKQRNPSISFILGNTVQGGDTVNITFPYASFDLEVSSPIVPEPTRYFPLRRADNDTQYTLGRTFLQESYLTVDNERSRFSVSQAAFIEGAGQNLVSIISPNETSAKSETRNASGNLSSGELAGIIAGAVICFLLVIGALGLFIWKRRRRQTKEEVLVPEKTKEDETESSNSVPIGELNVEWGDGKFRPPEVEGSPGPRGNVAEVEGNHGGTEVEGSGSGVEMEGSGNVAEMEEGKAQMQELDAVHVYELPAGEVKPKTARPESGQERIWSARLAATRRKKDHDGEANDKS